MTSCFICYGSEDLEILPCPNHVGKEEAEPRVHPKCLDAWASKGSPTCPFCRKPLPLSPPPPNPGVLEVIGWCLRTASLDKIRHFLTLPCLGAFVSFVLSAYHRTAPWWLLVFVTAIVWQITSVTRIGDSIWIRIQIVFGASLLQLYAVVSFIYSLGGLETERGFDLELFVAFLVLVVAKATFVKLRTIVELYRRSVVRVDFGK